MEKGSFDELVDKLQKKIDEDEKNTYSKKVIKEYRNPVNFRPIEKPDAIGEIKGPCGDTMRIMLSIKEDVIEDAAFWTSGCGTSIACGNKLTSMVKGKKLNYAKNISNVDLVKNLDGLPKEHEHCAVLATDTLRKALKKYHER
jgi:nitrogen fixation NifU-like protein